MPSAARRTTQVVALVVAVAVLVAGVWMVGRATDAALAERGRTATTSGELFAGTGEAPSPVGLSAEARSGAVEFAAVATEQIQELDDRDFDADVAAATELMTDSMAAEYRRTAREIRSTSPADGARVEATVDGSGLVGVRGDRAEVLVFSTSRHVVPNGEGLEATEQWAALEIVARR